ncbi:hypothetical protein ONZ45_g11673 [Pleurotus djamor]|nr:hypothetical protein ONZ45_g11673 [Pleurotus djamor]
MSGFTIVIALFVILGLMACAAFFTPKGPHQVTIRTSAMLTLASCYLIWMITYIAQLHPLVAPHRSAAEA